MKRTYHEYRTHDFGPESSESGLRAAVTIVDGEPVPDRYVVTSSFTGSMHVDREELIDFCRRVIEMDNDVRFYHPPQPAPAPDPDPQPALEAGPADDADDLPF